MRRLLLKQREFIYVDEIVPKITEQEYKVFLLQFQKSLLFSLKKKEILMKKIRLYNAGECCIEELEKQIKRKRVSNVNQ